MVLCFWSFVDEQLITVMYFCRLLRSLVSGVYSLVDCPYVLSWSVPLLELNGEFMMHSKSWLDCKYLSLLLLSLEQRHYLSIESVNWEFTLYLTGQLPVVLRQHQPLQMLDWKLSVPDFLIRTTWLFLELIVLHGWKIYWSHEFNYIFV